MEKEIVKPAEGRLGILVVGCGAVATTFMTGVLMARKGLAKPIGSMTQYDKIRVGRGKLSMLRCSSRKTSIRCVMSWSRSSR